MLLKVSEGHCKPDPEVWLVSGQIVPLPHRTSAPYHEIDGLLLGTVTEMPME